MHYIDKFSKIHTRHFNIIKEKNATNAEKCHNNPKFDVRVNYDASIFSEALEQKAPDWWNLISIATRFLNFTEQRYGVNKLKLLGIVWSIDYFKYYLYVKDFAVKTDHRVLLAILKEHRSNILYNSQLSR